MPISLISHITRKEVEPIDIRERTIEWDGISTDPTSSRKQLVINCFKQPEKHGTDNCGLVLNLPTDTFINLESMDKH